MDKNKVAAVKGWLIPTIVKELLCFCALQTFTVRRFICDFSATASPLTSVLKKGLKKLYWNLEADHALQRLKDAFMSAPTLKHPMKPLVIKVDDSDNGMGTILSQRVGEKPKLHPAAFFLKKLTPAERNYDMGNRELLSVKLTLEEWKHWLEGELHPFIMFTDQKNLKYLRSTSPHVKPSGLYSSHSLDTAYCIDLDPRMVK